MDSNREAPQEEATVPSGVPTGAAVRPTNVRELIDGVASFRLGTGSHELIDQIRDLEDLTSAVAGLQARAAVAFDLSERREQAEAGVPVSKQGQGVSAQLALARRNPLHAVAGCSDWPGHLSPRCHTPSQLWRQAS